MAKWLLAFAVWGGFSIGAGATVETAKVQSEQPHPLPFSEVTKYDNSGVCVRRIELNATETCYQRQADFKAAQVKSEGRLVLGDNPTSFQRYVNELTERDANVLTFLQGTLDICKEYKITNYFSRIASTELRPGSVNNDLYALEIEFKIEGAPFTHRLFVLGRIATFADQTRYLTYDGLADYENFWATWAGTEQWEKKFGLPHNGKREDLPKFLKRGAGFAAPYTLDFILSQKVLNPRLR